MRWHYRCPTCGASYEIEVGRYLCDRCAGPRRPDRPLTGILEAEWEGDAPPEVVPLPVAAEWFPPIPVGNTPLWAPERLRAELGFPKLFLKDDTTNPTGSLKDRASYLVAAFAARHKVRQIVLASTGNAASSMAGVGAAAGIPVTVFLPESAPPAKRIQVLQYGAELRTVAGSYDLAYEQSLEYSAKSGALSRNTAYNPLTIEGKKSVAFEMTGQLAAALGRSNARVERPASPGAAAHARFTGVASRGGADRLLDAVPDHVFVPTGDGVILSAVYRGFENLIALGRISRMPIVWACQAEGSSAIARALDSGDFGPPVPSATLADSIAVDVPRNGSHALSKLKRYGGRAVRVCDREILSAQRRLASRTGLFAEPSSAAALAGFLKVRGEIDRESTVVLLITGTGLKDPASAARAVESSSESEVAS